MTRLLETEITIPVKVYYDYDEGERMTRFNPGTNPSIEIDKVSVVGPEDQEDIIRLLPQGVLNELTDECWNDLKI